MSNENVELVRGAWEASLAEDRIQNGLIVYQAYFNDQDAALEAARSGEQPDD